MHPKYKVISYTRNTEVISCPLKVWSHQRYLKNWLSFVLCKYEIINTTRKTEVIICPLKVWSPVCPERKKTSFVTSSLKERIYCPHKEWSNPLPSESILIALGFDLIRAHTGAHEASVGLVSSTGYIEKSWVMHSSPQSVSDGLVIQVVPRRHRWCSEVSSNSLKRSVVLSVC